MFFIEILAKAVLYRTILHNTMVDIVYPCVDNFHLSEKYDQIFTVDSPRINQMASELI